MRTHRALVLVALSAMALAGVVDAVGVAPLPLGGTAAPPPPPETGPRTLQATEPEPTLPAGCAVVSATSYSCVFEGTTQGQPIPANPILRPEGSEIQRFALPLGPNATLEAVATGAEADLVFLALDGGGAAYAAVPALEKLRHARVAPDAGEAVLVLGRAGNAGGDWRVEVTIENAPALEPAGAFSFSVPAPPAQVVNLPVENVACVQGWCVLGRDASRRATDVPLGVVTGAGAVVVNVTRTGGSGTAGAAILDASGAEVAATTLDVGGTDQLVAFAGPGGLGTWYLRFATDVADSGGLRAEGFYEVSTPPVQVDPANPGNGGATPPNGADPDNPGNGTRNDTDRDFEPPPLGEELSETSTGAEDPLARYLLLGFFASAVLTGLTGVAVVAFTTRKW